MTKMKLRRELRGCLSEIRHLQTELETVRENLEDADKKLSQLERVGMQNEHLKEELESARLSAAWYRREWLNLKEELEEVRQKKSEIGF